MSKKMCEKEGKKAMILAAGLGTRLAPLTDHLPKALVKVNGRPMLDLVLEKLIGAGFSEIIVNVHHFAQMVIAHIHERSYPGVTIEISDESQLLLDTGGALRKAQWFLDGEESFLVHNVDVISAIDLHDMMRCHLEYKPLATLAVSERKSSRYFLWDSDQVLRGWENSATGESLPATGIPSDSKRLAFSGIHIIDPVIFSHINQSGRFSIIPEYIRLSGLHPIQGYLHDASSWFDLGKVENIEGATEFLKNNA